MSTTNRLFPSHNLNGGYVPQNHQIYTYQAVYNQQPAINQPVPVNQPQNLAQNSLEELANFLIYTQPENLFESVSEMGPLGKMMNKLQQLVGFSDKSTTKGSNTQAISQLESLIKQNSPSYGTLKTEVASALESILQGRQPNFSNPVSNSVLNESLKLFENAINAKGSLMHFVESTEARNVLINHAAGSIYQTISCSKLYALLNTTQAFQKLHSSNDSLRLSRALNNLNIVLAHFGLPAEVTNLMQQHADAVFQMFSSIIQSSRNFENSMASQTPSVSSTLMTTGSPTASHN